MRKLEKMKNVNGKAKFLHFPPLKFSIINRCFVVLIIFAISRIDSLWSACMELNSICDEKSLFFMRIDRYSVSLASLKAIFVLFGKFAFDCACPASFVDTPMAVPFLDNCFDKANSFFFATDRSYGLITIDANEYDFGRYDLL